MLELEVQINQFKKMLDIDFIKSIQQLALTGLYRPY